MNIIEELKQREQAAKADAQENYWALVEAMAEGRAIGADECESVLSQAGKTPKDLEADLPLARRVIDAREDVESYPDDADSQAHKARAEHGELLRRNKHIRDVELPRAERESEAQVFHAENQAHYWREAVKELAAAQDALKEARTGQCSKSKTESAPAPSPRAIVVVSGPSYEGWEPPSEYDYDRVQGADGVIFWRHRTTGHIVRRPLKNTG